MGLQNKHTVAVGIETIRFFNGLPVGFKYKVFSGEGGDKHNECGFREMEVCQKEVHYIEGLGRVNEDVGFIPDRSDFPVFLIAALQRTNGRGAYGENAAPVLSPAINGIRRIR